MADLASFIKHEFDGAWNAHDIDAVMRLFADDAVVTLVPPPPGAPGTFRGKEEIRGFVQMLIPGFHVESRNFRVEGDKVTWFSTVSDDFFRQSGVDSADANCEAVVQEGKIKSFTPTFTPETLAKLRAAAEKSSGVDSPS